MGGWGQQPTPSPEAVKRGLETETRRLEGALADMTTARDDVVRQMDLEKARADRNHEAALVAIREVNDLKDRTRWNAARASQALDKATEARNETQTYRDRDAALQETIRDLVGLLDQVIPVLDSHGTDYDLRNAIEERLGGPHRGPAV